MSIWQGNGAAREVKFKDWIRALSAIAPVSTNNSNRCLPQTPPAQNTAQSALGQAIQPNAGQP